MKIGYYHTTPFPTLRADNVHIAQMTRALSQLGHQVTLFIPRNPSFPDAAAALNETRELFGDPLGYDVTFIPHFTILGKGQTLGSAWGAWQALRKADLDLIYTRAPYACVFLPHVGTPFAFEAHEFDFHHDSKLINAFMRKTILHASRHANCRAVVTISDALRQVWQQAGVPAQKLSVAHDAVDLTLFTNTQSKEEARRNIDVKLTKPMIVYTGALFKDRGIEMIVQAAARLPEAEFYLIGGAVEDLERCRHDAEPLQLTNLHFVGQIPHREIPHWLAAADILFMQWTWRVPTMAICSPMKMFEYMAAQRLIVGPAFPTICEVLSDGEDAILFKPDDLDAMVQALHKGLALYPKSQMPVIARRKVELKYTWSERARKIVASCVK